MQKGKESAKQREAAKGEGCDRLPPPEAIRRTIDRPIDQVNKILLDNYIASKSVLLKLYSV